MNDLVPPMRKIHVIQGEYRIVDSSDVVLCTILGSCVAACLRDPEARVGGMNHFLLPGDVDAGFNDDAERYGVHLMELLVNGLLKHGARRDRLEAKVFGGARMLEGLTDIGAKNAAFARRFLKNEGIRIISEDLGGLSGRRLEYYPDSGRARQNLIRGNATGLVTAAPPGPPRFTGGSVELF